MTALTLDQIVSEVDQLPELPQALLKLLRMFEDPDVDAADLAGVVMLDPNLTAQILRLSNSAAYGLNRKVQNVQEAVAIIGTKTLKSLVYTIISHTSLERPVSGYQLESGALWLNAVTGAVYARHLAQRFNSCDPETAFTAALLRDLGKIVLDQYVGESYPEIDTVVNDERVSFVEAEEKVLGFSHNDVGVKVAEKWNLPDNLVATIQYNHAPSGMPGDMDPKMRKLVSTVHLADVFTLMTGAGVGSDGLMYGIDPKVTEELGIKLDNQFMETTLGELMELNSVVASLNDSFS